MDQTPKILIIDDEEAIVRVLSISLKSDGYDVVTALDGPSGLEVFDKERPDIVLTDIKMPGMDGIEVLKKVKERRPEAEVIIITGHGDIENAIEALKYGASDFLNKPIRDAALSIAIKRAFESQRIKRQLREYTDHLEAKVREATQEIRRQSNFLKKLIRSSNDGIVATDQDFKVVVFNPGAEAIFGRKAEDIIGKANALDFYPPELAELFRQKASSPRKDSEIQWQEATISDAEGNQKPVRFSGSILHEENRMMGSVAFFQDLTEIKRLQRELVQAERLAAVGQTVAGLAHGIKNILHGLKGGSYIMDVGIKRNDPEKTRQGWEMLKKNIERTSDLVMDLLSYSKQREPEFEPCDPNDIVMEVCNLVRQKAEENNIELQTDLDEKIGTVLLDPHTVHTTLLNLVTNAVDACIFDPNPKDRQWVRIKSSKLDDREILFQVSDNGCGMSEDIQAKLFTSFFSTKGHMGTGLGLLVTRKMIEEHGGRIWFDSKPGQGTTFYMCIPFKLEKESNKAKV